MNKEFDVIVIGGGTAGLGAYRTAKSLNKKALIIESNDFLTTCANVGCMPSKLLIAAAENMHEITKAEQFGINISHAEINQQKLWSRVRSERDRFVGFVKEGADNIASEDKIIGFAKVIDKNTVEVNGEKLKTKTIVIATGSSPIIPTIFENIKQEVLTNENVFELSEVPKSIAIFGAGVIGLELGMAFKNLGSKVFLFNRNNHLLKLNKRINDYLVNYLKNTLSFIYEEEVYKIEKMNNGYEIHFGNNKIWVEKILLTTGRKANLDKIGLKNIISEPLKHYNSKTTQISDLPIFLAGDVNNELTLLHEAANEGVIAGKNAANYPDIIEHKRNIPMSIIFSHPQIMQVGKTYDLPKDVIIGEVSFENQGRSRVMLKNKGLLNVYFDRKTHLLLGAEMFGPSAEHIAHLLAWSIEKQTTLEEFLNFPYYHPVIEEGVRTAFRDAASKI